MKLEIGNFHVKDIIFGEKTSFSNGILTINKQECLEFVMEDEHITETELYIVKPGDKVRLCPVKEAIEPRIKLNESPLFPGYTGELVQAGNGKCHALKD
jgi:glycine reductase